MSKKYSLHTLIKNAFLLKNANRHVSFLASDHITTANIIVEKREIFWEFPKRDAETHSKQLVLEKWCL